MENLDEIIAQFTKFLKEKVLENNYVKMVANNFNVSEEAVLFGLATILTVIFFAFAQNIIKISIALMLIFSFINITKGKDIDCYDQVKHDVINLLVKLADKKYSSISEKESNDFNRTIDQSIDTLNRMLKSLNFVATPQEGNRIFVSVTYSLVYFLEYLDKSSYPNTYYPCVISVATRIEDTIGFLIFIKSIFNETSDDVLRANIIQKVQKVNKALNGVMLGVNLSQAGSENEEQAKY